MRSNTKSAAGCTRIVISISVLDVYKKNLYNWAIGQLEKAGATLPDSFSRLWSMYAEVGIASQKVKMSFIVKDKLAVGIKK